jgi:hypothetical protein
MILGVFWSSWRFWGILVVFLRFGVVLGILVILGVFWSF